MIGLQRNNISRLEIQNYSISKMAKGKSIMKEKDRLARKWRNKPSQVTNDPHGLDAFGTGPIHASWGENSRFENKLCSTVERNGNE
jgi:hypothetical protein